MRLESTLKVKLKDGAPLPRHAKPGDAGLDLISTETVQIAPFETVMVGTGVAAEIPEGFYGDVRPRSSIATKRGITLANAPGTIDSSYRGEIMLPLHNITSKMQRVERGERVAQMILQQYVTCTCVEVDELGETERGAGGFGSTGTFVNENGEVI